MKTITKYSVAGVATVLLAACGSSSGSSKPTATTKPPAVTPTTKPASATPTTVKSATSPTTTIKPATTPTTTTGTAAGAELTIGTTSLGKVLVDGDGRTVYLYTKDTQNKPGTCELTCATNWPPLIAAKLPTAVNGLTASKLSLMKRADGTEQVAYNGWPLYLYSKDTKAGDVTGENVGGNFFAVDSAGVAVK